MNRHRGALQIGWLLALTLLARPCVGSAPSEDRSEGRSPSAKPAPSQAKPREAELVVRSKAAAERLRPSSTASRYDPNLTDWSLVPPWRKTSFFGVHAEGQFFVYVVDCSGSMLDDDRLIRAKQELRRSVLGLQLPQRFKVIFYNDQALPMPGDLPHSADLTAKNQLLQWLRLIEPDGETDPRPAMAQALALRPDAIFLLSDGEFPEGTIEAIAKKNAQKVPIHCIDLAGGAAGDQLQRIARESGGRYASRPFSGFVAD
jgi:hypothetical protein